MSGKLELGDFLAHNILKDRKSCFNAGFEEGKKQGALEELKALWIVIEGLKDSLDESVCDECFDGFYDILEGLQKQIEEKEKVKE